MNLNSYVKKAHKVAVDHGWWDSNRSTAEVIMMIVTELAEAVQEYRTNGNSDKFREEIADTFIRLCDMVGAYDIDIEKEIMKKHEYNKTRPYKHGKRF